MRLPFDAGIVMTLRRLTPTRENNRRSAQTLAAALRGQAVSFRPRILGFVLRRKQTRMNHQWCVGGLEARKGFCDEVCSASKLALVSDPKLGFAAAVYNAKNEA